jgi:hypothetical protein
MQVGMAREDPYEHDPVASDLHHLRHTGIGIFVPDDDEGALLQLHSGRGVTDVSVCEPGRVDTVEVNPQIPARRGGIGHVPKSRTGRDSVEGDRSRPGAGRELRGRGRRARCRSAGAPRWRAGRSPLLEPALPWTPGSASSGAGSRSRRRARQPGGRERERQRSHRTRTRRVTPMPLPPWRTTHLPLWRCTSGSPTCTHRPDPVPAWLHTSCVHA